MNEQVKTFQIEPGSIAKRFFIILMVSTVLLAANAAHHYYVATNTQRLERETREALNIHLGKMAITRNLADVTSDLMFLARRYKFKGRFVNEDPQLLDNLAKLFLVFSRQKGKYDQIRLLDHTGMEMVRVNYNDGNPTIIPAGQLQNKKNRYYFAKTWALERGEVYISPFDLNIERGQIEQPAKPIIRFSTLVFDRFGRRSGIILVNYLGAAVIKDFRQATANISEHVMLLNDAGYWLSSQQKDDEWGFMYDNGRTFAKLHPEVWQQINKKETGQFYGEKGMFSFETIHPVMHTTDGSPADVRNGPPRMDTDYHWKAVSYVESPNLSTALGEFFGQNLLLYGTMFSLLAGASILFARASVKHEQAVSEAEFEKHFRGLLEQMVKDRTEELRTTQAEKDLVVQHLIQAEKMGAIGTMASGIGHEINNPLYAILGMAEAIQEEKNTSQCHAYGKDIVKHTKEIAKTVRNLSGYVRPMVKQEYKLADVNAKIDEAVTMTTRTLLDNRIEIIRDLKTVPGILAKPEEIKQVFFNIIRNAIQAIGEEGRLEISSGRRKDRVFVKVSDSGIGIPEENLGKIFDPFFTTKGPEEGEGMGLYIAQQIVKKYGGTISFNSRKGEGTVCEIEFPVNGKKHKEV